MDWKRIKTILIVILLFTDTVLFLNLDSFRKNDEERTYEEIARLYEVKGIQIKAFETEDVEQVGSVVAERMHISPEMEEKIQKYFEGGDREYNLAALDHSIRFMWTGIEQGPLFPDYALAERKEEAAVYLEKGKAFFQFIGADFRPQFADFYRIGNVTAAKFYQGIYTGAASFSAIPEIESEIYLFFEGTEIVGVQLEKYLKLRTELGGRYGIISVDDAMYKALEFARFGDTLVDIRLVYKLNDNSLLATDLVRGEMFPYYELRFEQSAPIYVRAVK